MKKTLKFGFVTLIPFLVISIFTACSSDASEPKEVSKVERQKIENSLGIELKNLEGKTVSLDDYYGKVVLVNFWATWCLPCLQEMPDLVKLRENYKDKNFEIIGIVVNSPEAHVKRKVSDLKISYPILFGNEETAQKFGGFSVIPKTYILNQTGQIVEDLTGMQSYSAFEAVVKKHI